MLRYTVKCLTCIHLAPTPQYPSRFRLLDRRVPGPTVHHVCATAIHPENYEVTFLLLILKHFLSLSLSPTLISRLNVNICGGGGGEEDNRSLRTSVNQSEGTIWEGGRASFSTVRRQRKRGDEEEECRR